MTDQILRTWQFLI